MAINLGDAVVSFKADMTDLNKSIATASRDMKKEFGGIMDLSKRVGEAFAAMGATITGSLGLMIKSGVDYGDTISDLSKKTGLSTEAVSDWGYALGMVGASTESLGTMVKRMDVFLDSANQTTQAHAATLSDKEAAALDKAAQQTNRYTSQLDELEQKYNEVQQRGQAEINHLLQQGASTEKIQQTTGRYNEQLNELQKRYDEVKQKGQELIDKTNQQMEAFDAEGNSVQGAAETLQRLGLNQADLMKMNMDDRMKTIAMAIANVSDSGEKAALAVRVFGKSGTDILPVLAEGSAGLQRYFEDAKRFGLELGGEDAAMLHEFHEAILQVWAAIKGLGISFTKDILPQLERFARWIIDTAIPAIKQWIDQHPQLLTNLLLVVGAVGSFMVAVGPILIMLPGLATLFKLVSAAVGVFAGAISEPVLIAAAVVAALVAIGVAVYKLYENWDWVKQKLSDIWEWMKGAVKDTLQGIGAAARTAVDDIVWIFTHPIEAIETAWTKLKNTFYSWWESIKGFFKAGWDFVSNILKGIGNGIDWVWDQLTLGFNGQPQPVPTMAEGGTMPYTGMALVGERGPELVRLPQGAEVIPSDQSRAMMGGSVSVSFGNIVINGVNDPKAIADKVGIELERRTRQALTDRGLRLATI